MKHEYTADELAELKSIYDESGEAGLNIHEMLALRKAGLLTQGLPEKPAEPSKRDLILAHCKKRIDQGKTFDGKETAEALGMSQKTAGNILGQLRKEGLLPAYDKRSPRKTTRKTPQPERRKKPMTTTSKPAANKEEPMSQTTTPKITADTIPETKLTPRDITVTEAVPEKQCESPRAIIANALVGIYDSISALQRAAYHANDKVVYMFATKLMNGELMDIKANYSKDVAK